MLASTIPPQISPPQPTTTPSPPLPQDPLLDPTQSQKQIPPIPTTLGTPCEYKFSGLYACSYNPTTHRNQIVQCSAGAIHYIQDCVPNQYTKSGYACEYLELGTNETYLMPYCVAVETQAVGGIPRVVASDISVKTGVVPIIYHSGTVKAWGTMVLVVVVGFMITV